MAGTDSRLTRQFTKDKGCAMEKVENVENFLLFVLSSSSCTLIASVVLLLRPLTTLP